MIASATLLFLALLQQRAQGFDHVKHKALFPSCTSCHGGAAQTGAPLWPDPVSCAACHDGTIEKTVLWHAPTSPRRSNLRFDHADHASKAGAKSPSCSGCHTQVGEPRMAVRVPVVQRCLVCHGIQTVHLAAPDSACTTCHVSLVRTATLTREDVARFPAPPSHAAPDFLSPSGTPIHAPNAGRVAVARNLYFSGNTVVIDHGLGLFSLLAHMSAMDVREGDRVSAGQIVGRVGATGRVTGPHLHWAVRASGARVDPVGVLALLGKN